jgi:hypothetical protein
MLSDGIIIQFLALRDGGTKRILGANEITCQGSSRYGREKMDNTLKIPDDDRLSTNAGSLANEVIIIPVR